MAFRNRFNREDGCDHSTWVPRVRVSREQWEYLWQGTGISKVLGSGLTVVSRQGRP